MSVSSISRSNKRTSNKQPTTTGAAIETGRLLVTDFIDNLNSATNQVFPPPQICQSEIIAAIGYAGKV